MTQPSLFTDLPRTLARIRRLVREKPNDRELQRLLHTLLTSMSAEKLDEEAISRVLLQMEQRCPTASSPTSRPTRSVGQQALSPMIAPMASLASAPRTPTRARIGDAANGAGDAEARACVAADDAGLGGSHSHGSPQSELASALHGMQAQYAPTLTLTLALTCTLTLARVGAGTVRRRQGAAVGAARLRPAGEEHAAASLPSPEPQPQPQPQP
jgi:hypothetical protein